MRSRTLLAALLLFLAASPAPAESRLWTSTDGKRLQAELVDVLNGEAVLKVEGRPAPSRVPLTRLSPEDQEYVKAWKKPATPVPPKKPGGKATPEPGMDADGFPIGENSTVKRGKNGWPEVVALIDKPAFTVVSEDKENANYVYRSDHFEFTTTERLSGDIVREFSRLFETTYETVVSLPLRLDPKPPADAFWKVRLFTSKEDYYANGGIAGSGGVYMGRTREVMVPLPFLGVKKIGQRWIMEDKEGNHTLVHEVTHQVMHEWLLALPTWVTEGVAEYLTAGRYGMGRMTLRGYGKNMKDYRIPGREQQIRPLADLMTMDNNTWASALTGGGASLNYCTSMLLFYHFCHEDGDGTGSGMIEYFKARKGKQEDNDKAEREEYLLRGRSFDDMTKDFRKGLASAGIRIS